MHFSAPSPELSVVIPFFNEGRVAAVVVEEVIAAMLPLERSFEVIVVNDGSSDATGTELERVAANLPFVAVIHHERNLGQGAALWSGLRASSGSIIATMDGDQQNDPADFAALLPLLTQCDMVVGIRVSRKDSGLRRGMSAIANAIRSTFLRDGLQDGGCPVKVFRREVIASFLPICSLYSFLPAFAVGAGFRILEHPVRHRPRLRGDSKYGLRAMLWRPLLDMLAIGWLLRRRIPIANQDGREREV
jgi:glycosyltransferase involved in cell wall biosynthesis